MNEQDHVPFSTYKDLENYLRMQPGLVLVVFVSRNGPLQSQMAALKYIMGRHAGMLPIFVLPGGYCDLERIRYNIACFPTYLFLRAGMEVLRLAGNVTGRRLEDALSYVIKGDVSRKENRVVENMDLPLQ